VTSWSLELRPSARRDLGQLEDGPRQAAIELLQDLSEDPMLVPAVELRANPQIWRARFHQDRYRMIYQIAKTAKRVIVKRIRPRPTAYKGMKH
jgi:mRNA-degrading endonuclease RelE of RelBE toxin-antitoxin system